MLFKTMNISSVEHKRYLEKCQFVSFQLEFNVVWFPTFFTTVKQHNVDELPYSSLNISTFGGNSEGKHGGWAHCVFLKYLN